MADDELSVTLDTLEAVEMGKKACDEIFKVQMEALKNASEEENE